jgi:hypothetical protein
MATMEKRRRISLWILAAMVATGLVLGHFLSRREPVYQGKRLTEWLQQDEAGFLLGRNQDQGRQAEAAIRAIGTNAIPIYLKLIRTKESPLVVKFLRFMPRRWLSRLRVPQRQDYQWKIFNRRSLGAVGFGALREKAAPAVPTLIGLLKAKDPETRQLAERALAASDRRPGRRCLI